MENQVAVISEPIKYIDFIGIMLLVAGIIYIVMVSQWFIQIKKERKILFALNFACDLAIITKSLIRPFDGSKLNIKLVFAFIFIQWIISILINKFFYKVIDEKKRAVIIAVSIIYAIISIICLYIIFPNLYTRALL